MVKKRARIERRRQIHKARAKQRSRTAGVRQVREQPKATDRGQRDI